MVALSLFLAALLALPLSWLLMARYRRAVIAAMGAASPAAPARAPAAAAEYRPAPVLQLPMPPSTARARRAALRLTLTRLPAGAAYAVVMATGTWLGDAQMQGDWPQWCVLAWIYAWPAVVAAMLAGAADNRTRAAWMVGYLVCYSVVLLPVVAAQGIGAALSLLGSWVLVNAAGTLLVAVVSLRRVRSAGPLVLAVLLLTAFVAQGFLKLMLDTETLLPVAAKAAGALGLSAGLLFTAVTLLGLGLGVAAGWPLLRWLGRCYQARLFSDQGLLADALFAIFAITHTIGPGVADGYWYLLGVAAWVAYRATLGWIQHRAARPVHGRSLLLLRVFRLGARGEALFDRLRRQWQPQGPIRMIAGPDLAAATAAPHELLEWLAGRLAGHFIDDDSALAQRLARLQQGPDPDGHFRVDSLFCRDRTWRDAVVRLATGSDAVLMDLRSYGHGNDGCAWEIWQLLHHVPLDRVLLLVDTTTDRARLQATLDAAMSVLPSDSPNAGQRAGPVRLMVIGEPGDRTAAAVCEVLLGSPPACPGRGKDPD